MNVYDNVCLCMCVCLLCGKETFICSNSNPVILNVWMDAM